VFICYEATFPHIKAMNWLSAVPGYINHVSVKSCAFIFQFHVTGAKMVAQKVSFWASGRLITLPCTLPWSRQKCLPCRADMYCWFIWNPPLKWKSKLCFWTQRAGYSSSYGLLSGKALVLVLVLTSKVFSCLWFYFDQASCVKKKLRLKKDVTSWPSMVATVCCM
jgi:hypothetical protein